MSVKEVTLECTAPNCDLGQSGGRYKTPMLEVAYAMEMLRSHLQQNHDQEHGGDQQRQEPGDKCFTKPEKTRRPSLQKGISEDKYLTFERDSRRVLSQKPRAFQKNGIFTIQEGEHVAFRFLGISRRADSIN